MERALSRRRTQMEECMTLQKRNRLVLSLVTTAVLTSWQNADAATVRWVGDCGNVAGYATIQAAINAASAGDTVKVCPGSYTENVTINKPGLTVVSAGGAFVTRITAASIASVVTILQPHASLIGFWLVPFGSVAK